jgi:tRNA threonylcarbamoyladenosine biosynthesis protein TsaB
MSHILLIDTATKKLSLSIFKDKEYIGSYIDENEFSHAKNITIEINKLLNQKDLQYTSLSSIIINEGPGSFTGLRVGSSVAKGLCFALDIPLISINGIEAYANYFYKKFDGKYSDIFIMLDARRENYFYAQSCLGKIVKKTKFASITEIETEIKLSVNPWIYNSGKENSEELRSEYLIESAFEKWKKKDTVDISNFEPNYMLNNYQPKMK